MDLSKSLDTVGRDISANTEYVEEAVQDATLRLDNSVPPDPVSSEASGQSEPVAVALDYINKADDSHLNSTDEAADELAACKAAVSDARVVETDDVTEKRELILTLGCSEAVCDSEESSQFSAAAVTDDDSRLPTWRMEIDRFGGETEERRSGAVKQTVDEGSVAVRDSGDESQQLSCEPGSCSQSPMSFIVQLNEDSECSLPPGESGPTNFHMRLGRHVVGAEFLEDSSRCSQDSERMQDEPDLLMEVETGSTTSDMASIQTSSTTLYPSITKSTSASSRKSMGRSEDRNKSRVRKRVMAEPAVETEHGYVPVLVSRLLY